MKTALSFAVLILILSSPAEANILRLQLLHGGPGAPGFGWRSDSVVKPIYSIGYTTGWTTLDGKPILTRGFLIFDLKQFVQKNYVAVGAELEFRRISYMSPDPFEILGLFNVTTPVASLYGKGDIDPAIFSDLGSGAQYASVNISSGDPDRITIPLNANAIQDIRFNRGGVMSIGLSLLSASSSYAANESLFGSSSAPELRILIARVPEPTAVRLAISGFFGIRLLRRLRRTPQASRDLFERPQPTARKRVTSSVARNRICGNKRRNDTAACRSTVRISGQDGLTSQWQPAHPALPPPPLPHTLTGLRSGSSAVRAGDS
jgi:hypothetical protein